MIPDLFTGKADSAGALAIAEPSAPALPERLAERASARRGHVFAFQRADGASIGFHSQNLQVARLAGEAWTAIASPSLASQEALAEIAEWDSEIDPDAHDGIDARAPRFLSINVAQICNLKCTYCAAGGDGAFGDALKQIDLEKAFAQISRFVKALPDGTTFTLNFLGGEPLIAPHAIEAMIEHAETVGFGRSINFIYRVVTNGTLIDEATAEMLAQRGMHVQISLDGPAEINDVSRPTAGGASSTAKTLAGARRLFARKERLGSISVNAVHGAHNLDARASYLFLRQLPWDSIALTFDIFSKEPEASARFAHSLSLAAEAAYAIGGEAELRRLRDFDAYFETLDRKQRNRNFCGAGKSLFTLDSRANLTSCYWWAGDKREALSGEALDGRAANGLAELAPQFAQDLVEAHGCGACWARNICGGGCMAGNKALNGEKHIKDQAFCDRTRRLIAKGIELYERARTEA